MRIKSWILLLTLLLPAAAPAETTPFFQAGVEAFQQGEYEQALKYFRRARARGINIAQLYYNLGSTYYKLGRYREAAEEFENVVNRPGWRHLALYNLGLTAEARGDRQAALDYYSAARQAAGQSKIKQLADLKLAELQADVTGPAYALVSAAAGYDDNAVLSPDEGLDAVSREGDIFTEISAIGGTYLAGDEKDGVSLDAAAFTRLYAEETEYSFSSFSAGISRDKLHAPWHTRIGLTAGADLVEDELFAITPAFAIELKRSFEHYRLTFKNELSWIAGHGDYDYLTGVENRFTAELLRRLQNATISAGYRFAYNDREDLETETEFFSYSPVRNEIFARCYYSLSRKWAIMAYGRYRNSVYPDANRQINSNGGITRNKREDDRIRVSVRLEHRFSADLDGFAEYSHIDNDSNFSRYRYDSSLIMLGVQKTF